MTQGGFNQAEELVGVTTTRFAFDITALASAVTAEPTTHRP